MHTKVTTMVEHDMIVSQLWEALNEGDTGRVVSVLRDNDVNVDYRDVTHDLQTFLMRVCYVKVETSDLLEILEAIFDHSPDVNIQDSWGRTVLMHACIANKPLIIEGLLEYENTDVGLLDFEGNSVLSFAVQNCDLFTLEDILHNNSGPKLISIYNSKGQSPLTIAQKSGNKHIIKLFESYLNKTIGIEKKKVRKPRNRDVMKLPPTYSPSPERSARYSSADKEVQYNHSTQCNNTHTPRIARSELKLDISTTKEILNSGRDVKEKCDSAPVVRGDRISREEMTSSLSLSSPKFARRHHKQDCLLQETLLLNQSRHFPQMNAGDRVKNQNDIELPEYSLCRQRRPSISLPDLRSVPGFLVNSGSSTPTTEGGDLSKRSTPTRFTDDDCDDVDENDDVFSRSCPDTRKRTRPIFKRQSSERQVTLPEINQGQISLLSPAQTRKGVSPLTRNRKCSNSDDQLHRSVLK